LPLLPRDHDRTFRRIQQDFQRYRGTVKFGGEKMSRRGFIPMFMGVCLCLAIGSTAWSAPCTFTAYGRIMTLDGDCETESAISIPSGMTLDGKGYTITAVESTPGAWVGPIVENAGYIANVKDLTVTASGLACDCKSGSERLQGIRLSSATGEIQDCEVVGVNKGECGCQEGVGVVVSHPPFDGAGDPREATRVAITGTTVEAYQKGGIVVNGNTKVTLIGNQIVGSGFVDYIAQNGIQLSYGGKGRVQGNDVRDNWYLGSEALATGILVFESDRVAIAGNDITNSQFAISLAAWCYIAPTADRNRVEQNSIVEAVFGIGLQSYAYAPPLSSCSPSVSDNRISGNKLFASDGAIGIFVAAENWCTTCPELMPVADGNFIFGNAITGFETDMIDYTDNSRYSAFSSRETQPRTVPFTP